MGITTEEKQLFDSGVGPKDHKVAKYMLKSIGKDVASTIKYSAKAMGIAGRAIGRGIRDYSMGYVNTGKCPLTVVSNVVGMLILSVIQDVPDLQLIKNMAVGGMLPVATSLSKAYIQWKYTEAVKAVYSRPAI